MGEKNNIVNMTTSKLILVLSTVGLLTALLYSTNTLRTVVIWISAIVLGCIGAFLGAASVINSGKKYRAKPKSEPDIARLLFTKMKEHRERFKPCEQKVVTTVNLDNIMLEIINFTLRDYVMSWYTDLGRDEDRFKHLIQDEIWLIVERLQDRLLAVDWVTFFTQDATQAFRKHFQDIRAADNKPGSKPDPRRKFTLHPWLSTEERETEFLRKISEVCIMYLMSPQYVRCPPVRHLFREVITCSVLKPCIDNLCDPDYLNQKMFNWLDYREQIHWEHRRTFTYAATYEEFMTMIEECDDIEHLKQIRYNVISEIMQATTIQNLKRSKGLNTDEESSPSSTSKGDLLKARNLTRYLNQLAVCKAYCEKRIHIKGGPDYKAYTEGSPQKRNIPGHKVLSFNVIMQSPDPRNCFLKYLKRSDQDPLLRFWTAVESLKEAQDKHWHQMGGELYQIFISHPTSVVRSILDRTVIKGMETFLRGDTGPDSFYEAQDEISHVLEDKHYPSFIISDVYHSYIEQLQDVPIVQQIHQQTDSELETSMKRDRRRGELDTSRISEQSTYAQEKLRRLDEKIMNKTRACKALQRNSKQDPKVQNLIREIDEEIERFKRERTQLEFHIERTDLWVERCGKWKAHIYNSELIKEDDRMVPYFAIVVHLPGFGNVEKMMGSMMGSARSSTQGWVIFRKLDDFHALHTNIVQLDPSRKKTSLPRIGKFRKKSVDQAFLDKAKNTLEKYICSVLINSHLNHSESVYAFFSPSPEHLKQAPTLQKTKFNLANLFKSLPEEGESDSDDELLFGDEESQKPVKARDSIAGPLYNLIDEVFELKGVLKWFRKTFIVFVKVTFGRSVNRQLQATVDWLFSEPMLIYYLQLFRDTYWPDGVLAESYPPRSDEQKLRTLYMAKEKILENIPDAVKNLVGESNSKRGAIKWFESMQDVRLNKHIFYVMVELLMFEMFPELKEIEENAPRKREDDLTEEDKRRSRSTSPKWIMQIA